ncbi:ABC transporter permease [Catenuloplanes atrovinosus]|uniref:ABC transport system permease protein n=1 Tax=Catenuloplanes atrovinosus TaxID=137266 RepID=A0AAE3YTR3_9ACTN|nr:ABC transporter permease [Catenuloplanes atrovinosus]MDR7279773.1 putative ABC transport system permease protein [Catenuloplanes atrovinosus]
MSSWEILTFAVRGVAANRLRSALTMLGILIGVAAVILLVAVGNGSAAAITSQISALGTNTITVMSANRGGTTNTALTTEIADALQDETLAPDVRSVSPVVNASGTLTYDGTDHEVSQFIGTVTGYLGAQSYRIERGAAFTDADVSQGRRVTVIGQTVAEELFEGADPVGARVTVGGALFTVVGVLAEKSSSGVQDANDLAIAPLTAVQQTLAGYGSLSSIVVEAVAADRVAAAQNEIATILDQRLGIDEGDTAPYRIQNASQLLETQTETADTFTVLLGAVAGVSLLVGGIGITNIMLVTVTERTREIGIRKALGAPRRVILTQFLAEATILSLTGGGLGVLIAVLGARFEIAGVQPVIVPGSVFLALGVSVAIGLFFGGYPAGRAASLRPIDALRYE